MPRRLLDGEALWLSDKIAALPAKFRAEYANILPLALADGAFECDAKRVWRTVYAYNRPEIPVEFVTEMLDEMEKAGLLRRVEHEKRMWGYFVGIDKDGRLPPQSHASRYQASGLPPDILRMLSGGYPSGLGLDGLGLDRKGSISNTSSQAHTLFTKEHAEEKTSACETKNGNGKLSLPGFEKFFESYPQCRRLERTESLAIWIRKQLESRTEYILAGLEVWKISSSWNQERFIPAMPKFLNRKQWETLPPKSEEKAHEKTKRAIARIRENPRMHSAMDR